MEVKKSTVIAALELPDNAKEGHLWDDLSAASKCGDVIKLGELFQREADVRFQEPEQGTSALMLAAAGGYVDAVWFLLNHGAPWNAQDRSYKSAGEYCAESGSDTARSQVRFHNQPGLIFTSAKHNHHVLHCQTNLQVNVSSHGSITELHASKWALCMVSKVVSGVTWFHRGAGVSSV